MDRQVDVQPERHPFAGFRIRSRCRRHSMDDKKQQGIRHHVNEMAERLRSH